MDLGVCCLATFPATHSGWVVSVPEHPAAIGGHSVGAGGRSAFGEKKKLAEDQSLRVKQLIGVPFHQKGQENIYASNGRYPLSARHPYFSSLSFPTSCMD